MAWHTGRTFYVCPCGRRDEYQRLDLSALLTCSGCGQEKAWQWVPPAVERDRALLAEHRPADVPLRVADQPDGKLPAPSQASAVVHHPIGGGDHDQGESERLHAPKLSPTRQRNPAGRGERQVQQRPQRKRAADEDPGEHEQRVDALDAEPDLFRRYG